MIHNLLDRIVQILRQEFTGAMTNPATRIVLGPLADPPVGQLPRIALTPGKIEMAQAARDLSSSEPRPQQFSQEIPVNLVSPQGPYALAKTPLNTSTLCKLILEKGTLDERQILLIEGSDFTVNYQDAEITFDTDISEASSIFLRYSFVGVFTMQDFSQEFAIDIFETTHALAEKWAALALAAVLTHYDELLEYYNTTQKTLYSAGVLGSAHSLTQLQVLGGAPSIPSAGVKWQLSLKASGQLKLTKELVDGFNLIEKIRSPGRHSGFPVDIDVGLE